MHLTFAPLVTTDHRGEALPRGKAISRGGISRGEAISRGEPVWRKCRLREARPGRVSALPLACGTEKVLEFNDTGLA